MVEGITSAISPYTVDETLRRVRAFLEAHAIAIFAIVDHSGEAAKVGLALRPTKLVIFGNPKAGTPVMVAAPTAAIDLPLKLLVWADDEDVVRIAYNTPEYLARRHGVRADVVANLAVVASIVAKVVEPGQPG
ncbi:MAG TPA: DUF302 domain-containing protein [Kofleriaceae bacterium]|nr:DUF302 domain-containing protein [Kofleriaceae bacterium]